VSRRAAVRRPGYWLKNAVRRHTPARPGQARPPYAYPAWLAKPRYAYKITSHASLAPPEYRYKRLRHSYAEYSAAHAMKIPGSDAIHRQDNGCIRWLLACRAVAARSPHAATTCYAVCGATPCRAGQPAAMPAQASSPETGTWLHPMYIQHAEGHMEWGQKKARAANGHKGQPGQAGQATAMMQ